MENWLFNYILNILHSHLHVLQLFDQRPAAHKALVEQSQNGRTFQDGLPESSPGTYRPEMR